MIGLLPEEAALRKALLASMQSLAEKTSNKKPLEKRSPSPSPLPPSKRAGSKQGGRKGEREY